MAESNLATNLWADSEISHDRFGHHETSPQSEKYQAQNSEIQLPEIQALEIQLKDQELISAPANLRLESSKPKSSKPKPSKETSIKTKDKLRREIKKLKSELSETESLAQALHNLLHTQFQYNWEQQQHELMASVLRLRAFDLENLAAQEQQIRELNHQNLLLEQSQKELLEKLKAANLELSQNSQTQQKLQSRNQNLYLEKTSLEKTGLGKTSRDKNNISLQVVLEQSLRSLQVEYSHSQNRIYELESQLGELQEQILKQSGQAIEYEASVQHWKEKCIMNQNHALQLISTLERFIDNKDIPKLGDAAKVDLPTFLVKPVGFSQPENQFRAKLKNG